MTDSTLRLSDPRRKAALKSPRRKNLADLAVFGMLLLFLTDYDAVFGYFIRVPSLRLTSMVLGLTGLAYLLFHLRQVIAFVSRPLGLLWSLAIFALPAIIGSIQLGFGVVDADTAFYFGGLNVLVGIIFLQAVILSFRTEPSDLKMLAHMAFGLALLGFAIQYFHYETIRELMHYASNRLYSSLHFQRLVGFFEHPNYAAFAAFIYAYLTYSLSRIQSRRLSGPDVLLICASGFIILATGSRTSLLIYAVFVLIAVGGYLRTSRKLPTLLNRLAYVILAALAGLGVLLLVVPVLADSNSILGLGIERLGRLLGVLSGQAQSDVSIDHRLSLLWPYLTFSAEAPLLGHGPGISKELIAQGVFDTVSQNSWIQWALDYGYLYVGFVGYAWVWTFFKLGRTARRSSQSVKEAATALRNLLFIALILTFSLGALLTIKAFAVAFGLLLGQLWRHTAQGRNSENPIAHAGPLNSILRSVPGS